MGKKRINIVKRVIYILSLILSLGLSHTALAQERIVFINEGSRSAFPINLIDSITVPDSFLFNIYPTGQISPLVVSADSALFMNVHSDTLKLDFHDNWVDVRNPKMESIEIQPHGANITIRNHGASPFVCMATGSCQDGRLIVDSDTTCTLLLSNLYLSSREGSAIYIKQKQKAEIVLMEGTINTLMDAANYNHSDTTDTSNGCIYSKGSLTFRGGGILNVYGNHRHSIFSSKNITVEDGSINILNTQKDGIHCDKYKQKGGIINLHLSQIATKGVKTKKEFELKNGNINGVASADLKIEDGETSYCTLIKSDSLFTMSGGELSLKNTGKGGRCISVENTLKMTAGIMHLECHGDGGRYLTAANDSDYYTSKCITADDSIFIQGGHLNCLSTGLGGKGIVAGTYLAIGNDTEPKDTEPVIRVETKGECIINNVDEDQCFGCPKGIKVGSQIDVFCGDIRVNTSGSGGEGIECKGIIRLHKSEVQCITCEDGINAGQHIVIDGAHIYCYSTDNDGIDSNGKITMKDGIVVSISQHEQDESFDSDNGRFYIFGGIVFGIGRDWTKVREVEQPYYSTGITEAMNEPITLHASHYLILKEGEKNLYSVQIPNDIENAFITCSMPFLSENYSYRIVEAVYINEEQQSLFDGKLIIGGYSNNYTTLKVIQPQI